MNSNLHAVSAITVFGDPTFTHSQSFDAGTDTTTDGVSFTPRFS
jgi:acetylxylan esterase